MTEMIPMWVFYLVLLFVGMVVASVLFYAVKVEESPLQWSQFVSTLGKDGKDHGDLTKLGQLVGIIVSSFIVLALAARVNSLDWVGFAAIFTLYLTYVAGVQMFQAYMKSKNSQQPSVDQK
jgi:hypothetical protein